MLTLTDALQAISPATTPTPRFVDVPVLVENGFIVAYNGNIAGWAPIAGDYGPISLNAARLKSIWSESCRMSISETFTTISRGKTKYRLLCLPQDAVVIPPQVPGGTKISSELKDAILFASNFMSENALHLWANGVTVTKTGVIATNNQIIVKVPIEAPFDLTLPQWALEGLKITGLPIIAFSEGSIKFQYDNGIILQAQRLSVEMPEKFGELSNNLVPATEPIGNALEQLLDVSKVDGKFVVIEKGTMTVTGENGEEATTETNLTGTFKMSVATAALIFKHAEYVGWEETPQKIRFSNSRMCGIAVGAN